MGTRCDQLELNLLGYKFTCSLHVFDFIHFENILGMDWLGRYEVMIFCQDREHRWGTLIVITELYS